MIHSLAGGVLADGQIYTFAKISFGEETAWYLAPDLLFLKEGDKVLAPQGHLTKEGTVVKLERGTKQTAPVPAGRLREVLSKV